MKTADGGTFAMDGAKSKANWEVNPLLTERRGAEDGMDVSLDDWEKFQMGKSKESARPSSKESAHLFAPTTRVQPASIRNVGDVCSSGR